MTAPAIHALVFGPALPPQGRAARAEPRSRALVLVYDDGREEEVAYASLRARTGGWDGGGVTFEWNDGDPRAVVIQGDALRALRAAAPEPLREKLGARRPQRAPLALWIAGTALVALAAAVVLVFATQSHRLVDAAAARIPPEWEERLGQATLEALTAGAKEWPAGEATRVLEDLGARLASHIESPYTFRWVLLDDPQVNAMAAPGGFVIVYTGLMDRAATAEELAGVLAHEVQHVVLRHSLRGIVRSLGFRITLSLLLGGTGDLGAPIAAWVEHLGGLRFSRQQETEADLAGLDLLRRAGIDGHGMAAFFDTLAGASREPPAFLSTHPASEARARAVRQALAQAPVPPPLDYDWAAVQAELERGAPR